MFCRDCSRVAALSLAAVNCCAIDVQFDAADGHAIVIHQRECRAHREFLEKVAALDEEEQS